MADSQRVKPPSPEGARVCGSIPVAQGCRRCPALVANRRRIVHGYGPKGAAVLFVGEAPGYKGADLTGVPFTRDRSGVRLQRVFIELGLSEEGNPYAAQPTLKCFVTNVVRCNPPSNRAPTGAEIANCLPFLWQEIDLLQPQILVPIGNVAARALFPRLLGEPAAPITHMHAQVLSGDGMSIVPMRHPARISNRDLERFCSVMHPLLQGLPHP